MRRIEFKAGYHEWNIFVDDNIVYSFSVDYEELDTKDKCNIFAEEMIYCMQEEFEEKYEDTNPHFTQDELEYLKKLIGETLYEFYGE